MPLAATAAPPPDDATASCQPHPVPPVHVQVVEQGEGAVQPPAAARASVQSDAVRPDRAVRPPAVHRHRDPLPVIVVCKEPGPGRCRDREVAAKRHHSPLCCSTVTVGRPPMAHCRRAAADSPAAAGGPAAATCGRRASSGGRCGVRHCCRAVPAVPEGVTCCSPALCTLRAAAAMKGEAGRSYQAGSRFAVTRTQ